MCDFLLAFREVTMHGLILYHFRDTAGYWLKTVNYSYSICIQCPFVYSCCDKTSSMVMFSHFDAVPDCDRQHTDGHSDLYESGELNQYR